MQVALKAWGHLLTSYLPGKGTPSLQATPQEEQVYKDMVFPVLRLIFKLIGTPWAKSGAPPPADLHTARRDRHLILAEVSCGFLTNRQCWVSAQYTKAQM